MGDCLFCTVVAMLKNVKLENYFTQRFTQHQIFAIKMFSQKMFAQKNSPVNFWLRQIIFVNY